MTNLAFRLISAAAAATVKLVLFNAVVSIAEPQLSVLIAKVQRLEKLSTAPLTLAAVANHIAKISK